VLAGSGSEEQDETSEQSLDASEEDAEGAAIAGTLRAPRKWERLLVEAAVIGGNPERWRRRLDGLAHEFTARLQEVRRLDPEAPRGYALLRELAHLTHLRSFVLPIVDEMAGWPSSALWGDWLDRLEAFAPRVLRTTPYVLRVLADLRPMSDVGPVTLEEVRAVLAERLRTVDSEPPARRYGRVFVEPHRRHAAVRSASCSSPEFAERIFPQKPAQDPLLRDEARLALESGLATRADHSRRERVLLRLAAGAAVDRLCVSYPRLDVAEGRARVPSFYALDLLRGATGRIPDHDALERAAAQAGDASLAWPAPADAALAIDDQEHDLAVLGELLEARDVSTVRGHAQYMLRLNPALRRSVTERWARGQKKWSPFDGLTRVTDGTRDALAAQRLGTRPYSLSALQKFSICPYQFLLSAVIRLQPFDDPVPLQRLDPLTKGTIVHEMQARVFRDLQERTLLPVTLSTLDIALRVLEEVVVAVAGKYYELLAPAIDRVWREEIASIARDMRGWLRRIADEGEEWTPKHFELSFGLRRDGEHDPASVQDPVILENGFQLRGSVDLIEEHRPTGVLRVTDHKTGKDRHKDTLVIGGGAVLQPVLYSLVVEQITGKPVAESRLFFCTSAGGYKVRPVMMTPLSRRAGIEALEVVDRAIELGALPTAPAEQACAWCDFRSVCGPHEELRVARKPCRSVPRPPRVEEQAMTVVLSDQDARDRIRTRLDETLVVEAAAGTGKTTELVSRILRVLATGAASVSNLVAVTFTEKAAGELKLRLRRELETARQPPSPDDVSRHRLEDALNNLEEAHISTIHGFCADLLRERPVEAAVDPLFAVLTEPQARRLYDEAFNAWFQDALRDMPEGVRRSLRRSSRPAASGDADVDGPVERLRRAGWELAEWRDFPASWIRPDFNREAAIVALVEQVHAFATMTARPSFIRDYFFMDTAAARRASHELQLIAATDDLDAAEAALVDLARDRDFRRARKGSGATYGKGVARVDVHTAQQALLLALDEFRADADADLAALLRDELRGAIDRYDALKARHGALDFLDLLLRTRDLVRDRDEVRRDLQRRFTCLFVDEFQDTDPLQAEILLLLCADDPSEREWTHVRPVPGKLFIVGDPKQSIYRFRRADVGVYRDVCEQLASHGAGKLALTTSFRSVPDIQRFVNTAFASRMTGDRDTLQSDYVRLAPHRPLIPDQPVRRRAAGPEAVRQAKYLRRRDRRVTSRRHRVRSSNGWCVTVAGRSRNAHQATRSCRCSRDISASCSADS
jgi:CRISPR/Cas system-associated exonuclease Cas4 (RecB family)